MLAGANPTQPVGDGEAVPWTVGDFLLTVVTGLVGVVVVGVFALTLGLGEGEVLLLSVLGQYGGHLTGLRLVTQRRQARFADLGLEVGAIDGLFVLVGLALQVAIILLFAPLVQWLEPEGSGQAITQDLPEIQGALVRVGLVVTIGLFAPVVEELMFRGLLTKALARRFGPRPSLWLVAGVFALFHLMGIGGEDPWKGAAIIIPQIFLVGLVLGRLTQVTRRLGASIFVHSGFNLLALVVFLFNPGGS